MKIVRTVTRRILLVLGLMSMTSLIVQLLINPDQISWSAYIFWAIITATTVTFEIKSKSVPAKLDTKNAQKM
jgi:hypothetical protein